MKTAFRIEFRPCFCFFCSVPTVDSGEYSGRVGEEVENRGSDVPEVKRAGSVGVEKEVSVCEEAIDGGGEGVEVKDEDDGGDGTFFDPESRLHAYISPENLPPADLVSLVSQEGAMAEKTETELSSIIAPPDTFCGDDSATPTPQPETESMASGTITPRTSPCDGNTPISPVSPLAQTKDPTPPVEVCTCTYTVRTCTCIYMCTYM